MIFRFSKSILLLQVLSSIALAGCILIDPDFFGDLIVFPWVYFFVPGVLIFSSLAMFSALWINYHHVTFKVFNFFFCFFSILISAGMYYLDKIEVANLFLASTLVFLFALICRDLHKQLSERFVFIASFLCFSSIHFFTDNSITGHQVLMINLALLVAGLIISLFLKNKSKNGLAKKILVAAIILPFIIFFTWSLFFSSTKITSLFSLFWLLIIIRQDKIDSLEVPNSKLSNKWHLSIVGFLLATTTLLELAAISLSYLLPHAARNLDQAFIQTQNSWSLFPVLGFTLVSLYSILQIPTFLTRLDRLFKDTLSTMKSEEITEHPLTGFTPYFFGEVIDQLKVKLTSMESKSSTLKEFIIQHEILQGTLERQQSHRKLDYLSRLISDIRSIQDPPVTAQIVATSLFNEFKCGLVAVYSTRTDENRLIPLAVSSENDLIKIQDLRIKPSNEIVIQAIRAQKCLIFQKQADSKTQDIWVGGKRYKSLLIDPLLHEGVLQGLILLADEKEHFFLEPDTDIVEISGAEVISAWSQASFIRSLQNLIDSSTSLASINDLQSILDKIVEIGQLVLRNRFTGLIIQNQEKLLSAFHGKSPELQNSIESASSKLAFHLLKNSENIIYRDFKREKVFSQLVLDDNFLKTLMIVPIHIHGVNIGTILFFGKKKANTFSEKDSFLAGILSMQASSLIEGCILDQELRNNLISTQLLHGLNLRITLANDLETAVKAVTETAHRLTRAKAAGLIIYTVDGNVEVSSISSRNSLSNEHPKDLIQKAMVSKKVEVLKRGTNSLLYCFPLNTSQRTYGGLWCEVEEESTIDEKLSGDVHDLVQQASIALERTILLKETRDNADQVSLAYFQLQSTYDQTLMALVSAVDLRDRETEGHSIRVAQLALSIGKELGLNHDQLKSLERGSLLHDIGKIGIDDEILHKTGPLSAEEWKVMKQHPRMGAQIIESIPFLKDAVPVVAFHQERWDGSGYPEGLKGNDIPLLARIFAVADVFDALISDRPYHKGMPPQDAAEYLKFHANILFDSDVIKAFIKLFEQPNFLRKIGFYEL